MRIDIVTIFPLMFKGPFEESIIKRAQEKNIVEIKVINLRNFSRDRHRNVDDYPYGGGPGMVFKPEPFFEAVKFLSTNDIKPHVVLLSPQGNVFNQEKAFELTGKQHLILLCGHYEGVDERVRLALANEEISIGDYILTGGELPAMIIIDSVVRLLPGVLNKDSVVEESFSSKRLEYPQYTRPSNYKNLGVPYVLLSGDHRKIDFWRRKESLKRTLKRRPELLLKDSLSYEDKKILQLIIKEEIIIKEENINDELKL